MFYIEELKFLIGGIVGGSPIIAVCSIPTIIFLTLYDKEFKAEYFGIFGYLFDKLVKKIK